MAMGPERSKPLHNFSLPCLKWGNQRFLRCVKVAAEPPPLDRRPSRFQSQFDQPQHKQIDPSPAPKPSATQNPLRESKRKSNGSQRDIENNMEAVREKIMVDLRVAAEKLQVSIFEEGAAEDDAAANARPWNLRTRRAACKAPTTHEEERKFDSGSSPVKVGEAVVASENPPSVEKVIERSKFSVSLSKK